VGVGDSRSDFMMRVPLGERSLGLPIEELSGVASGSKMRGWKNRGVLPSQRKSCGGGIKVHGRKKKGSKVKNFTLPGTG